jgi:thiamine biosynthesis lipoprotein
MQVTLLAASQMQAAQVEAAVLAVIDHHERILSAWRPDSELNRWLATRGTAEKISPELFEVLSLFDQWHDRTGGAIDASVEAAIRTWQAAANECRWPTATEIAAAVDAMQQVHWHLNTTQQTATRLSATPLVLASFTKSYIADRALDAAHAAGASGALLNIGGDIVVRGNLTQIVKLADPAAHSENEAALDLLAVRDRTVATSCSYRRGFSFTSQASSPQFSHILDPRTALPVGHIQSSTVISRNPVTAGALATAFSILRPEETRLLAANMPGTEYLLVIRDGQRIASDGWRAFQIAQVKKRPTPAIPDVWNQSYELEINLEVATQSGQRSHRPYVAVWIEDDRHESVRTIALWYDKMRYLPELRDWAHDNQMRVGEGHPDISQTVGSATRAPGQYICQVSAACLRHPCRQTIGPLR